MINPWTSGQPHLVSLSSGRIASSQLEEDAKGAYVNGEKMLQDYISERLVAKSRSVFDLLPTGKLQTFASKVGTKSKKSANYDLKSDHSTFARLLIVAKNRDIDLRTIMSYSLSSVPATLSTLDGLGLSKTPKSKLLHCLRDHCKEEVSIVDPQNLVDSILIVDAMAVIQAYPTTKLPKTFNDLADSLLAYLFALADRFKAKRLDFVGDRYLPISIKNAERGRRTGNSGETMAIYGGAQELPKQWKKFLASAENKRNLQKFILEAWSSNDKINTPLELLVAVTDNCVQLRWNQARCVAEEISALTSDHEEADTRLVLHAKNANMVQNTTTVIWSQTQMSLLLRFL